MNRHYQRWLGYTTFLYRRRYALLGAVLLLIVGALLGASRIRVSTSIRDMLPEDHPMVASYNRIDDEFSTSAILVTVEGSRATRDRMVRAAHALAAGLEADPELAGYFRSINLEIDREFLLEYGFLLTELDDLEDLTALGRDTRLLPFLRSFNDNLEAAWLDEGGDDVSSPSDEQEILDMFRRFEGFAEGMSAWIDGEGGDAQATAEELLDALFIGDRYFFSPDYSVLIMQISPAFSLSDRDKLSFAMERIGEHLRRESAAWPELSFGTAGDIAQEADEEKALGFDAVYPALAALVLILLLFYFSLNNLRSILFAVAALAAGIVLDLGVIGITIGELNMITSSFGALLVGLGIDFGIHLVSRFDDARESGADATEAMARTLTTTGRPVAVGAVTTAVAFYALMVSRTLAFRQFGFVAGTGILLVLAAMFSVLPLLLLTWGPASQGRRKARLEFRFLEHWGSRLERRPVFVALLLGAAALSVFSLLMLPRLTYSVDIRKIGPQNTPSKQTEELIIDAFGLTPFPSFAAVDDLEEARHLTDLLRDERIVRSVSSPADYLPSPEAQRERYAFLQEWRDTLDPPVREPLIGTEDLAYEIQRLEWNIIEIADISVARYGSEGRILELRDEMIREIAGAETGASGRETFRKLIARIESSRGRERLARLDPAFADAAWRRFRGMSSPRMPLTAAELPAEVRREMIAPGGESWLVTLYPTDAIETRAGMLRFDERMHEIDNRITGTIPLALVLAEEIRTAAGTAGIAVIAVVFLLLLAVFRSLSRTLLALANLLLSVLWMMGINSWISELNMVNILALPLIIGIGIDYSVHLIHGMDSSPSTSSALASYGKAVLLAALTTMIGFGSLAAIGTFRGIATLGTLLFLGAASALLASLTLLPALLARMHGYAPEKTDEGVYT